MRRLLALSAFVCCSIFTVGFERGGPPKKVTLVPRIVSQERIRCDVPDDPFGPCRAERIVLENPLTRSVTVTLSCGSHMDEQAVKVFPRTRQVLEVELTVPGSPCRVVTWK